MTRLATKRITSLVGLAILATMVWYLFRQQDLMASLRSVSVGALALTALITVGATLTNGVQFQQATRVFGMRLGLLEAHSLAVTNTMLNYAVPLKGGILMRAAYMKRRYGLSYTDYGALLASSQLVIVIAASIAGLVALSLAWALDEVGSPQLAIGLGAVVVCGLGGLWLIEIVNFTRLKPERLGQVVQRFSEGFGRWRKHRSLTAQHALTVLVGTALQGLRLFVIFHALRSPVPMAPLVAISAVVIVSSAVSITPGNLGVKEVVTALTATLLGIDGRIALLASLVDRAMSLLVTVILGLALGQNLVRGWGRDSESAVQSEQPSESPNRLTP